MLEPEPLRKVSAHAGNDPSRAKCRVESTAEPVKCLAEAVGFADAENVRRIQRRLVSVAAQMTERAVCGDMPRNLAASAVLDSGGTGVGIDGPPLTRLRCDSACVYFDIGFG